MKYFILLMFFWCAVSNANDPYPFHTARHQRQFQVLLSEFRCVVCEDQNLSSSQSIIAVDSRNAMYQLVREHHSNRYIERYVTEQYGDSIILKPSNIQAVLLLWIFGFVMIGAGVWVFCRARRK